MPEKVPNIEWMERENLHPAPWNPLTRTDQRRLKPLVESMEREGFWPHAPLLVARGNIVADGNRRLRAAEMLQIPRVPIIRVNVDAQELWAHYNGTAMAVTVRQVGEAVRRGLEVIPDRQVRVFDELLAATNNDWNMVRDILERGASPSIIRNAQRVANYCGMHGDNEFIARAMRWLVDCRMTHTAMRAIAEGVDPGVVLDRIATNQPITHGGWR